MTPEGVMDIGRNAMEVTLMVAGPMLVTVLLIGLLVSIFQAATGPWMLTTLVDYMHAVFTNIPAMAS